MAILCYIKRWPCPSWHLPLNHPIPSKRRCFQRPVLTNQTLREANRQYPSKLRSSETHRIQTTSSLTGSSARQLEPSWMADFFLWTYQTRNQEKKGTGPLFLIQVGNQTRDVNQNNQSLRMNLYIKIYMGIYTIQLNAGNVLTGVSICYGTNKINTPTMEVTPSTLTTVNQFLSPCVKWMDLSTKRKDIENRFLTSSDTYRHMCKKMTNTFVTQLQGLLYYQPKQCIITWEIPQNYHLYWLIPLKWKI